MSVRLCCSYAQNFQRLPFSLREKSKVDAGNALKDGPCSSTLTLTCFPSPPPLGSSFFFTHTIYTLSSGPLHSQMVPPISSASHMVIPSKLLSLSFFFHFKSLYYFKVFAYIEFWKCTVLSFNIYWVGQKVHLNFPHLTENPNELFFLIGV